MIRNVKLIEVKGSGDFQDLVGREGRLCLHESSKSSELNWFNAGNGDVLSLGRKRVTEKDGKVSVSTDMGNTFIFRLKETNL
jgi:hypothetical protein